MKFTADDFIGLHNGMTNEQLAREAAHKANEIIRELRMKGLIDEFFDRKQEAS